MWTIHVIVAAIYLVCCPYPIVVIAVIRAQNDNHIATYSTLHYNRSAGVYVAIRLHVVP